MALKPIDVRPQPRLGFARTVEIVLNGIRYRLFRSAVTVVVIAVAVAFMMNVLCEAVTYRSVRRLATERTAGQRLAARWAGRLSAAPTPEAVLREIGGASASDPILDECRRMGNLADSAFDELRRAAADAVACLDFFDGAGYAARRMMVKDAEGTVVFDRLQSAAAFDAFTDALARVQSARFPMPVPEFGAWLASWPGVGSLEDALLDARGGFGDAVRAAGFVAFDAATADVVARQAREARDIRLVEESGQVTDIRKAVAAYLNVLPGDVTADRLWRLLESPSDAGWFLGKLKAAAHPAGDLGPGRAAELARLRAGQAAWEVARRATADVGGGRFGVGTRMAWLVLVSLGVCAVGISNAMLMSVTERFREIATLKCLGALDGSIMLMFVLEACLLGLAGGLAGSLLGSLIGFGRMLGVFGGLLAAGFPFTAWLVACGLAVLAGVVLAALAGVYPSYLAARLAPMEAMRIE
ncbi:MAG: Macrolide export ATP-binding/permease protein MacB [Lentisphaerae bacterium ADurb.BinA184]|nr:MAG: Macrolide export ATP-binding/permease protein MacB [Lentisphaerae bacterium ADurb.BinA184]